MGLASGLLDVAMNANAVAVERGVGRPIMSGIHGVWSAGLLAASAAAVVAAALHVPPVEHLGTVAIVITLASVPLLRHLLAPGAEREAGEETTGRGRRSIDWAAVLPLGIIGFCSFLGEGAMHDWSAVYLRETLDTTPAVAALGFAGFALGMTCSRFVADGLIVRFGPRRVVRTGGLVAGTGLVLGLAAGEPFAAIAGFTVLGAALAPVVPTVFSAAGNLRAGAAALGWVVTISYVGGILGPALIGFASRVTGLGAALGIPAVLAFAIAALAGRVEGVPGRRPGPRPPDAAGRGPLVARRRGWFSVPLLVVSDRWAPEGRPAPLGRGQRPHPGGRPSSMVAPSSSGERSRVGITEQRTTTASGAAQLRETRRERSTGSRPGSRARSCGTSPRRWSSRARTPRSCSGTRPPNGSTDGAPRRRSASPRETCSTPSSPTSGSRRSSRSSATRVAGTATSATTGGTAPSRTSRSTRPATSPRPASSCS